jgi:hypothetical protein
LRRARNTCKPPESRTTADAAEAPSISGATVIPANAELAAPTNNKLKPKSFDMTLSSDRSRKTHYSIWRTYFLRRARRTSNPPASRTIADVADAPSISGAATAAANADLAAPASSRLKPRSLYTFFSSDECRRVSVAACPYFLRRARKISNPPESKATADTAEARSISGAATPPANAKLAAPAIKKLRPIIFVMIFSSD